MPFSFYSSIHFEIINAHQNNFLMFVSNFEIWGPNLSEIDNFSEKRIEFFFYLLLVMWYSMRIESAHYIASERLTDILYMIAN